MRPAVRALGRIAEPPARAATRLSPRRTLTLVGWHRIGDADDGLTTTADDFRRHLDVLEQWGAAVLPVDEAVARLRAGTLPRRAVSLSFDDGYASVAEVAWPELRRRGLPATLYAVSGFLDGRRTFPWDAHLDPGSPLARLLPARALAELADDGIDVGSHTVTHRWLPALTAQEVLEETYRSRVELEDLLQRPVRGFAYPMGGWTPSVSNAADRAGYDHALTVDRGRNVPRHPRMELRRAFAFDRADDVRRQLDGGYTWMRPSEDRRRRRAPEFGGVR